jgi:sugar/nucleoside kinase (ribokinase family)
MADIAVLGLFVADIVGRPIDALPPRGTLGLIERIELHIGGNGANTCAALGKLGISCAAMGKVGADSFGEFLVNAVSRDGADIRGVVRDPASTTSATIVTVHSDAERTFLHVAGANATYTPDEVIWEATDGASIFYVAGLQLMLAMEGENIATVLQEAKRRGMTTVLDTVMNPRSIGWNGLAPAMPFLDWAIPSFEEAAQHTGERTPQAQAEKMKAAGAKNVAIKDGAAGCHIFPATGAAFHVPSFDVAAIDALGAGDCWAAGFLTGLLHNWPLEKTGLFANAVGACSVTSLGATTGVKSLAQTLEMLESSPVVS